MSKPTTPRQQFWKNHIEAQRRSGKSQSEYCLEHSLRMSSFSTYVKRFSRDKALPGDFVKVATPAGVGTVRVYLSQELFLEMPATPLVTEVVKSLIEVH